MMDRLPMMKAARDTLTAWPLLLGVMCFVSATARADPEPGVRSAAFELAPDSTEPSNASRGLPKEPADQKKVGPPQFRGRPLPIKKGFPLIQAGVLGRLNDRGQEATEAFAMDLGGMKNLSPRHALGMTLGLVADTDYTRIGLKPRYRRWLGRTFSLDVAPGIFLPIDAETGPNHHSPGFVGELSLSAGDWVSLTGLVEVVEKERPVYSDEIPAGSDTQTSYYLGAKAGGEAGIVTAILMGLAVAAFAGSY
jgi:hypothetical protein